MIVDIKQGRKLKRKYQNVIYDSLEEVYIRWYLDELLRAGMVRDVKYQPEAITLVEPVKYNWIEALKTKKNAKQSMLLGECSYTYDFRWEWDENLGKTFCNDIFYWPIYRKKEAKPYFKTRHGISRIDVKGGFAPRGSNLREFEVKRKWLYQKAGMFVQKIIPEKLFKATFTPERYLSCDKALTRKRTIHFKTYSLDEFLEKDNSVA